MEIDLCNFNRQCFCLNALDRPQKCNRHAHTVRFSVMYLLYGMLGVPHANCPA